MEKFFMNTINSKTNEPHKLTVADKRTLADPIKNMVFANLRTYCTWKKIKSAMKSIKLKISAPTWDNEFDLFDESYPASDI